MDDGAGHLREDDALAKDGAEGESEGPVSMVMVVVVVVVVAVVVVRRCYPPVVYIQQKPRREGRSENISGGYNRQRRL